jgi:hypothetical protein
MKLRKRLEDLLDRNRREHVGEPYTWILGCELALEAVAERAGHAASNGDEVELPGVEAVAGLIGLRAPLGVDACLQERSDDAPVDFRRAADYQRSRRSGGGVHGISWWCQNPMASRSSSSGSHRFLLGCLTRATTQPTRM